MCPVASEVVKLTARIVMSHASITELTPAELMAEIKAIYEVLASLAIGEQAAETVVPPKEAKAVVEGVKKLPIMLGEIVKAKYVVCLECGNRIILDYREDNSK